VEALTVIPMKEFLICIERLSKEDQEQLIQRLFGEAQRKKQEMEAIARKRQYDEVIKVRTFLSMFQRFRQK
jgi:hypothetical protein